MYISYLKKGYERIVPETAILLIVEHQTVP
jgi:hypothetical protein